MKKKTIHVAIGSKNPCKIESVKSAFHKVFQKQFLLQPGNQSGNESEIKSCDYYELVYTCHNVPSNVNDQPIGDDETLTGAKNRALAALEKARLSYYENEKKNDEKVDDNNDNSDDHDNNDDNDYGPPDFGVGLEGGIETKNNVKQEEEEGKEKDLWCMAWMAIVGTNSAICTLCKHESSTFSIDDKNEIDTKTTPTNTTKNSTESTELKWGISKTAIFKLPQKITNLILNDNIELGHADDIVFNRVNSKHGSGTVGVLTNDLISRSEYYDHALVLALFSFIWPEHYI
jgi:non-canonical (house-cleaning) NTP pyrophosphatase